MKNHCGRVHSVKFITKAALPYLVIWSLYYAWTIIFTTWWTYEPAHGQIFTAGVRSIIHSTTLISSAIFICFYKKEWFVKTARFGAALLVLATAAFLFVMPSQWQIFAAPLCGILMGLVCVSILMPYVYAMNNTEKYYGMIFGFVIANAFSLVWRQEWINSFGERIASIVILIGAMSCVLFFKKDDIYQGDAFLPVRKTNRISYLTLLITCSFAIFVKGIGKIILDNIAGYSPEKIYFWHFAGGLAGCVLCFLIFAWIRGSLYTIWNATFSAFLLAALCFAFANNFPAFSVVAAIFIGISGTMGMITLYYNMGVIGRKYRNMNHLKLSLWFGVLGGAGSVLLGRLFAMTSVNTVVVLAGISAAVSIAYFIFFPFLLRAFFTEEWVSDSELGEMNEMLSEPLKTAAHEVHEPQPSPRGEGSPPEKNLHEQRMKTLMSHALDPLTSREYQTADCIMRGLRRAEIAEEMGVLPESVTKYINRIYDKFGIHRRQDLFRLAETLECEL